MGLARATPHRFTAVEYHLMGTSGVLKPDDRVELIEGEIIDMGPIGSRHAALVGRLLRVLVRGAGERGFVNAQSPVLLSDFSEPVPDLTVLKPRADDYSARLPNAEDVLLLIVR